MELTGALSEHLIILLQFCEESIDIRGWMGRNNRNWCSRCTSCAFSRAYNVPARDVSIILGAWTRFDSILSNHCEVLHTRGL